MRLRALSAIFILWTLSCDAGESSVQDAASSSSSSSGAGGAGGAGGGSEASCEPTPVACADDAIQKMNYQTDKAPGKVENEPDGSGFLSTVDARAGGFGAPDPDSYVYGRFTETGLEKVDISDEESLDSMDWDIALRRFIIRINSGDSGPSCVTAARVPGTINYDEFTVAAPSLKFNPDDYYTDSCDFIEDGNGLGTAATALSRYWEYPGCVKMTGNVYVLELRDGKRLKLTVSSYYSEAAQKQCDTTSSTTSEGSAIFRFRWAFLQ